ncbi:MAG TPA: PQQ-binding-like beta-propeller repeat protein [Solirubrobacterales bacterium]|nr:PQQ-binding-like beta-propeller repeat protein [Solirubrobacterales bacterium]
MRVIHAVGAIAIVLVLAFASGCGGGDDSATGKGDGGGSSSSKVSFGGEGHPNVDAASTRKVGGPIDSSSVPTLKPAWEVKLTGQSTYGSYASTPVVTGGVVYSQDLASNVEAIDLESGEVLWKKAYESPSHGPNGLAVAEGLVFGATADSAFALDQETGKEVWSVKLAKGPTESIDMAPGIDDGKVYISTVPVTPSETYGPGAVGTLYALDGKTGKEVWHFDTVPKSLWGNKAVNSGGGLWYPPSFDGNGGVYIGTGNPGPLPGTDKFPFGSSRPGNNLYADSMVKLDAKTGKLDWFYQVTPHNIYDWDFQNPPVLVKAGGRELAIGSGKSGIVIAFDAKTGKPVWKRSVGKHNGHDKDPIYAMRGEYSKIKKGEVFPGALGGVIAPMATDGKLLFVPVVDHSLTLVSGSETSESGAATGALVAIDVATGKIEWQAQMSSPAYGAPLVANDVVFATAAEGLVYALSTKSGGELWSAQLPSGTNAGVTVSGDTLLAGAGLPLAEGQVPTLVAYQLGG